MVSFSDGRGRVTRATCTGAWLALAACGAPGDECSSPHDGACDDGDPCTEDVCDDATGSCSFVLVDRDGDGIPACADCDDARADVTVPTEARFRDCDDDGFASTDRGSFLACPGAEPAPDGDCQGSTALRPVDLASTDCDDRNAYAHPDAVVFRPYAIPGRPGDYDWNCDGVEEVEHPQETATEPELACRNLVTDTGLACAGGTGEGFEEAAPDCGEVGVLRECADSGYGCYAATTRITQACR